MCEEPEKVNAIQAITGTLEFAIFCLLLGLALYAIPQIQNATNITLGEQLILYFVIMYGTVWGINKFFIGVSQPIKFFYQKYKIRKEKPAAFNPPA